MHGCYSAKGSKDIKLTVNLHAGFLIIVVLRITNNNQHTEHSNQIMEKLTVKIPKELKLMSDNSNPPLTHTTNDFAWIGFYINFTLMLPWESPR